MVSFVKEHFERIYQVICYPNHDASHPNGHDHWEEQNTTKYTIAVISKLFSSRIIILFLTSTWRSLKSPSLCLASCSTMPTTGCLSTEPSSKQFCTRSPITHSNCSKQRSLSTANSPLSLPTKKLLTKSTRATTLLKKRATSLTPLLQVCTSER